MKTHYKYQLTKYFDIATVASKDVNNFIRMMKIRKYSDVDTLRIVTLYHNAILVLWEIEIVNK